MNASGFFKGMMTTALGEHDLLTAIELPAKQNGQGAAYVKFTHPASRYAVIGVAAAVTVSGGTCTAAAVAVGGLVPRPMRAPTVEKALAGRALSAENWRTRRASSFRILETRSLATSMRPRNTGRPSFRCGSRER